MILSLETDITCPWSQSSVLELIAEAKSGGDNFPPSHQVFMTVMMDVEFDTDLVMDDYGVIECSLGGELHTHSASMVANRLLDQNILSSPLFHNWILILAVVGERVENHL